MLIFCLACLRSFLASVSTEKLCEYKSDQELSDSVLASNMSNRGEHRDRHIHISVSHLILIVLITLFGEDNFILMTSLYHEIGFKVCQI